MLYGRCVFDVEVARTRNLLLGRTRSQSCKSPGELRLGHGRRGAGGRSGRAGRGWERPPLSRCPVRASERVGMCTPSHPPSGVAPDPAIPAGRPTASRSERASGPLGPSRDRAIRALWIARCVRRAARLRGPVPLVQARESYDDAFVRLVPGEGDPNRAVRVAGALLPRWAARRESPTVRPRARGGLRRTSGSLVRARAQFQDG